MPAKLTPGTGSGSTPAGRRRRSRRKLFHAWEMDLIRRGPGNTKLSDPYKRTNPPKKSSSKRRKRKTTAKKR